MRYFINTLLQRSFNEQVCSRPTAAPPRPPTQCQGLTQDPHPQSYCCLISDTVTGFSSNQRPSSDVLKKLITKLRKHSLLYTYAKISNRKMYSILEIKILICLYVCLSVCMYVIMLSPHNSTTNGRIFKIQTPIIRV